VAEIVTEQQALGNKVFLFNYEYAALGFSSWSALHWHPYITEHAAIASALVNRIESIVDENGWPENSGTKTIYSAKKSSPGAVLTMAGRNALTLQVAKPGTYRAVIHTLQGKIIAETGYRPLSTGNHRIPLNGTTIATGMFMVRIESEHGAVAQSIQLH